MPDHRTTAPSVADEFATRREIEALLAQHMIAENQEDIPGIMATLTPEPVFVIRYLPFNISNRWWWSRKYWSGREAVMLFYRGLFATFDGFHIDLAYHAVSSKGVVDCARLSGRVFTRLFRSIGLKGIPVRFTLYSFLAFNAAAKRLAGEDVYLIKRSAFRRLGAVALAVIVGGAATAAAQTDTTDRRFDLVPQSGRDPNGFMLNPRWFANDPPLTLDPIKECGALANAGVPGYRSVLLKRPDCISEKQRHVLRLSEPQVPRVFGGACGQTQNDGSIQGHLDWFPVTVEGELFYNETSTKTTQQIGGDFDHTFELIADSTPPATRWNPGTHSKDVADSVGARPTLHVELDLREVTHRIDSTWGEGATWWKKLKTLADGPWASGASMMGTGRVIVTGLLGLDAVHHGHTELHPIYGLALLQSDRVSLPGGFREQVWIVLARDRGNEGNCASGIIPLDLGRRAERDTFRIRLPEPSNAAGAPTIVGSPGSFLAKTSLAAVPRFEWVRGRGLNFVVDWPQPIHGFQDATALGRVVVRWPIDPAKQLVALTRRPRPNTPRPHIDREPEVRAPDRAANEAAYYEKLRDDRLVEVSNWSPRVDSMAPQPDRVILPAPATLFPIRRNVLTCADVAPAVNPRCAGTWSIVGNFGARTGVRFGDHNYRIGIGVTSRSLYFLAGNVQGSLGLEFRHYSDTGRATRSRAAEVYGKVVLPAVGVATGMPGLYPLVRLGIGADLSGATKLVVSPGLGIGLRAPMVLRTQLGVEVHRRWFIGPGKSFLGIDLVGSIVAW